MESVDAPRIFLSASVPLPSRDRTYFDTADVLAIRDAIRALTMVVLEHNCQLIFGGHPAITPMIRLQIAEAGADASKTFVIYQSRYFERVFPPDNTAFEHVELVDAVPNDRTASLQRLREQMLAQPLSMGIFIGGMDGVEKEYALFRRLHRRAPAYPIASTGAAAGRLFNRARGLRREHPELRDEVSYLTLMRELVGGARRAASRPRR